MFLTLSDLGSSKHVVDAEVDQAQRICQDAMDKYKSPLASIQVDNAARGVARKTAERFPNLAILVGRDPSHTADLGSKNLAELQFVKDVLAEVKEISGFLTDRISSIRDEAYAAGRLDHSKAFASHSDTRMNDVHLTLGSALDQYSFFKTIWMDPNFRTLYDGLPPAKREKMKEIIDRCNDDSRWERITKLRELTGLFFKVHKALSREDFPLSAFILLTQALHNEISNVLSSAEFDLILGEGASEAVDDMMSVRFNMDGKEPQGTTKVGLHDRHHLMSFLVDPFNWVWRSKFQLQTNLAELVTEMINLFVPLDDGGASTSRDIVREDFMVRC